MKRNIHVHDMDEIARTLEGELGILLGCKFCGKTEVDRPTRKQKKSKYVGG